MLEMRQHDERVALETHELQRFDLSRSQELDILPDFPPIRPKKVADKVNHNGLGPGRVKRTETWFDEVKSDDIW